MPQGQRLLIQNALCFREGREQALDLLIEGDTIARVGHMEPSEGAAVLDAGGLAALPGAVDSHVHFHMPAGNGRFNADDFAAGSACAVCGGTASVVDFASPAENESWTEGVRRRRAQADGYIRCDYGLHMEVTGAFKQDIARLGELRDAGVRVLKIYTTYGADRYPREKLPALFREAKKQGFAVLAHCEDDEYLQSQKRRMLAAGQSDAALHAASRPAEAEVRAAKELIALSESIGTELIIAHVSAGETGQAVAAARRRGVNVHAETCPHYLLLNDSFYAGTDPQRFIMTPPLRTTRDNEVLWELLASGDIGMVSTDHCPFLLGEKLAEPTCFGAVPAWAAAKTWFPCCSRRDIKKGGSRWDSSMSGWPGKRRGCMDLRRKRARWRPERTRI